MPVKQDSINRELYGMLKSRGYRPDMFTSAGKKVAIPDEAEAFQFDFIKDGENYGKVTATVDGLHRLIIYYGDEVENSPKADTVHEAGSSSGESFNSLRKHLKRFAKNKQLGFELSDIDDLEPDMAKREHNQKDKLSEGYYAMGKTKSYSDNVPSTKIILQHSRQIEEGEQRYRNIAKIFVENTNGERFLLPTTKPGIARVYARHIAEGGTPYDERGTHITSLVEEYNKMAGFVRATKNKEFNESVQRLISEGINHYGNLRETLHKMAGRRGYNEYFENYTPALMENEEHIDLSEMFRQSSLDPRIESVMPILGKLSKNINETSEMVETLALESWADEVTSIKVDEARHDDDKDDGLIAGRYTPKQWAEMLAVVKKKAQEQDAKKQQPETPLKEFDMAEDVDSIGVNTRQATLNTPAGNFTADITKDKNTNTVSGKTNIHGVNLSATKDMTPGGAQTVAVDTNVAPNLNLSATRKSADYNKGQLAGTKSVAAKYTDTTGALGEPGQQHTATRTAGVGFGGASGPEVGKNYVDQYSVNENVDTGEYDARKSTSKGGTTPEQEKEFRNKVQSYGKELEQRQKEKKKVKEGQEDLDAILRIIRK
jgi:hypothetical protein